MKNLISNWPGRLVSLFVPAALVVSFFAPSSALAIKEMSIDAGGTGGGEGDPLDTNDAGGGGGSGGTDMHNDGSTAPIESIWGLSSDRFQVLLVPEVLGGVLIFKIIVIDKSDLGLIYDRMEEYHAP